MEMDKNVSSGVWEPSHVILIKSLSWLKLGKANSVVCCIHPKNPTWCLKVLQKKNTPDICLDSHEYDE